MMERTYELLLIQTVSLSFIFQLLPVILLTKIILAVTFNTYSLAW